MVVRFSQRMGLKSVRAEIQKDSMDESLKNGLWNALYITFLDEMQEHGYNRNSRGLAAFLWDSYFNLPLHEIPPTGERFVRYVSQYINSCEWFEVYDLMEEVLKHPIEPRVKNRFLIKCKTVLQRELSAYRLINDQFVPIVSDSELEEIEKALRVASDPVRQHLEQALGHFSDRQNPDYRNAIKESISAVEWLVKKMSGDSKLTFALAVNKLKDNEAIGLHSALANSFKNLYGMTSDVPGIRHGKPGESIVDQEDARFMVVTCSAIVNLLTVKADKAGIDLRQ